MCCRAVIGPILCVNTKCFSLGSQYFTLQPCYKNTCFIILNPTVTAILSCHDGDPVHFVYYNNVDPT